MSTQHETLDHVSSDLVEFSKHSLQYMNARNQWKNTNTDDMSNVHGCRQYLHAYSHPHHQHSHSHLHSHSPSSSPSPSQSKLQSQSHSQSQLQSQPQWHVCPRPQYQSSPHACTNYNYNSNLNSNYSFNCNSNYVRNREENSRNKEEDEEEDNNDDDNDNNNEEEEDDDEEADENNNDEEEEEEEDDDNDDENDGNSNTTHEQNHHYNEFKNKYMQKNLNKTSEAYRKTTKSHGHCSNCHCQNKKLFSKNSSSKSPMNSDHVHAVVSQCHNSHPKSNSFQCGHASPSQAQMQNNFQRSNMGRSRDVLNEKFRSLESSPAENVQVSNRSTNVDSWYHFDESCMAWLPVGVNLQKEFDTNYARVKDDASLKNVNPHFTFQIYDTWYGVRFDFSKNTGLPFGEQYKLNSKSVLRNVIKAQPDSHGCINGLPVQNY